MGYVIAAYAVVILTLAGYAIHLWRRRAALTGGGGSRGDSARD